MSQLHPRKYSIQYDMTRMLDPLLATEAVAILAHVMAHVVDRDIRQFQQLTNVFKKEFAEEHHYLNSQTRSGVS